MTFEAVKEQLEILGHQVPDDVVRDFLADLKQEQATQPATSASGGSPSAQQAGAASSQLSADHGHSLAANAQTQCNTSRARFTMDVPELSGNYASTDANQAGTYAMPCMPTGSDSLFQVRLSALPILMRSYNHPRCASTTRQQCASGVHAIMQCCFATHTFLIRSTSMADAGCSPIAYGTSQCTCLQHKWHSRAAASSCSGAYFCAQCGQHWARSI